MAMDDDLIPPGAVNDDPGMFKFPAADNTSDEKDAKEQRNDDNPDRLAIWALKKIDAAKPKVLKWRVQAEECDSFKAGHLISELDLEVLNREQRPTSMFNPAQKWIEFVSGVQRSAMVEMKFLARDPSNDEEGLASEKVTKAYQWAIDKCDGEDERSRAFVDMYVRGMGWTSVSLNRMKDVSGIPEVRRINGHEMIWDVDSGDRANLAGVKWIARERQVPKGEALKRWPKHVAVIMANSGSQYTGDSPGKSTLINEKEAVPQEATSWPSVKKGFVKVIEFQWKDEVVGVHFYDPLKDQDDWLSEEEFDRYHTAYKDMLPELKKSAEMPINENELKDPQAIKVKLAEKVALENLPDEIVHDRQIMEQFRSILIIGRTTVAETNLTEEGIDCFTFNCMTGKWDDKECYWYGGFRLLIDPQRYLVKFANQVMEIIIRNAKGGLLIERSGTLNPTQLESEWSKIGGITYLPENAIKEQRFKEKTLSDLPQGSLQMFQVCMGMLAEVTGISPEQQMGMASSDQPAMTMRQRQNAGLLLLSSEFASLHRYMKNEAECVFYFLKLIADNRWFRIGGPFDNKAMQLIKDDFYLEYEVVLEEGTRDPNIRDQWWRDLKELLPTMFRTGMFHPDVFDFAPFPASFRMKMKQVYTQQMEQKKQMSQMGLSDGGRGKPRGIQEVQADLRLKAAKAQLDEAKAAGELAKVKSSQSQGLIDLIIKREEMNMQSHQNQQEMGMEREKHQLDIAGKKVEAGKDMIDTSLDIASSLFAPQQAAGAPGQYNPDEGEGGK